MVDQRVFSSNAFQELTESMVLSPSARVSVLPTMLELNLEYGVKGSVVCSLHWPILLLMADGAFDLFQ